MKVRDVLDVFADELEIPFCDRAMAPSWYLDRVLYELRKVTRHDLADCIEAVDAAGKL